ncbi:MAG: alpha-glucan family phosphorylase [Planctomycetota bacterium]|jgi:starch phosphorylase
MNFKKIFVYPKYPENLQRLYDLACNLWSTWNYDAIGLFYRIDGRLFREVDNNPVRFLQSLSKERLKDVSNDKGFLFEFEKVWEKFQDYLKYAGSYKDECAGECNFEESDIIAYFSMEFGLHESIHTYAGGLGVLSGDFLKGASDLGLPVIGIGILYKYGYFTQHIDLDGYQQEVFDKFENHLLPIRELHNSSGRPASITIKILDEEVKIKLWEINVGKSKLILLDTDIKDNPAHLRDITNELYVGDREKRLQQEVVLGLGGIKALDFLGIKAKIYHFNEGHSSLAIIARLEDLMRDGKFSLSQARCIIRSSTVFTTHTPVIAGNEHFNTELVKKYLQPKVKEMGIPFEQIARFGYMNNNSEVFWLPAFAMQFSRYVNAVSRQHARLSRKMWCGIFPERPIAEIPIYHVTNGVHTSWISPPFVDLFNRYLGPDYIHCTKRDDVWRNIYRIPDEELWEEHRRNKKDLVNFIRRQFNQQLVAREYSRRKRLSTTISLNVDYLTVVFARRFAAYKRPTLILKNKERFSRILANPSKPVQMVFAGKAHPADEQSKQMIKEIIDFAREYGVDDRLFFLENYDMNIARHLHWGADVWLNTPSEEMEASGTSGMKAAMNGVLHLSMLEGWWVEGYNGENGWAITAGSHFNKPKLKEIADANQLYELLESEITELYYNRSETDIPDIWVKMMKESMFSTCQNFNMNRTLCNYLQASYIPAKKETVRILDNDCKLLRLAEKTEQEIMNCWDSIELVAFSTDVEKKEHIRESERVEVECGVKFGSASPEYFKVELFYMYDEEGGYKILPMQQKGGKNGVTYYNGFFEIERYGVQSLNVRVKPANEIIQDMHPEFIKWKD